MKRVAILFCVASLAFGTGCRSVASDSPPRHRAFAMLPHEVSSAVPIPQTDWNAFFDALDPAEPVDIERAFARIAMEATIDDVTLARYLDFLDAAASMPTLLQLYPSAIAVNDPLRQAPAGLMSDRPGQIDWRTLDAAFHQRCSQLAVGYLETMAACACIAENDCLLLTWGELGEHALTLSRLVDAAPVDSPLLPRMQASFETARQIYLGEIQLAQSPCVDGNGRLDPELQASYEVIAAQTPNGFTEQVAARCAGY